MDDERFAAHRAFLKDSLRLTIDFSGTDQSLGVTPPPIQKPPREDQKLIPLPPVSEFTAFTGTDVVDAIAGRQSRRKYREEALTPAELAFLLWSTQGIRKILHPAAALRTVPSAGCRHSFESYLAIFNVEGLAEGLYRYLPVEHALVLEDSPPHLGRDLARAALGQTFVSRGAAAFLWTAIPARMEWRYHLAAHRVILIDAGHVCQNLYLACEAISAGTCAIAAFHQDLMDTLLGVDGEDEFALYLAPVGKV